MSAAEIVVVDIHKKGNVTLNLGQIILEMVRHPLFHPNDIRSKSIVHLLRRFKRQFAEIAMETYNLWKEVDENQLLEFLVHEYLEMIEK